MMIIDIDGRAEQWIIGVMLFMQNMMLTLFVVFKVVEFQVMFNILSLN